MFTRVHHFGTGHHFKLKYHLVWSYGGKLQHWFSMPILNKDPWITLIVYMCFILFFMTAQFVLLLKFQTLANPAAQFMPVYVPLTLFTGSDAWIGPHCSIQDIHLYIRPHSYICMNHLSQMNLHFILNVNSTYNSVTSSTTTVNITNIDSKPQLKAILKCSQLFGCGKAAYFLLQSFERQPVKYKIIY